MPSLTDEVLSDLLIAEFDDTIDKYGTWGIYTRSDHRFVCRECYDIGKGDSAPDCGTCFGTGFKVELQRWKFYFSNSLRGFQALEGTLSPIGFTDEDNIFVFTKRQNIPVINDRFFVVEWSEPIGEISGRSQPTRLVHSYRVTFMQSFIVGKVVYYLSHCYSGDEALDQYSSVLLKQPIIVTR